MPSGMPVAEDRCGFKLLVFLTLVFLTLDFSDKPQTTLAVSCFIFSA
jgi:hypothetical protein